MADITITGDARLDKIKKGLREVGNEAEKLKRKNSRGAMGILEVSRAVEDFSVAGMRGAINNIPGIVQSISGSMAWAGAISLAAVAIWKLGPPLINFLAGVETANSELKKTEAISDTLVKKFGELRSRWRSDDLKKQLEAASTALSALTEQFFRDNPDPTSAFDFQSGMIEQERAFRDRINAVKDELASLNGKAVQIDFFKDAKRTEEDLARVSKLLSDIELRGQILESFKLSFEGSDGIAKSSQDIRTLERNLALAESRLAGFEAEAEALGKESESAMDNEGPTLQAKQKALELARIEKEKIQTLKEQLAIMQAQGDDRLKAFKLSFGGEDGIEKTADDIRDMERKIALAEARLAGFEAEAQQLGADAEGAWAKTKQWAADYTKMVTDAVGMTTSLHDWFIKANDIEGPTLQAKEDALDAARLERERLAALKEQLEVIKAQGSDRQKQMEAIERELAANDKSLKSAAEREDRLRATLRLQQELAAWEEAAAAERNRRASMDFIRNLRIDPSSFLSSSGRVGGSGAEYQNAIGMINYQRQSLKFLAEIARNTKDGRTPVWN